MEISLINLETDYEIVKGWWEKHSWPVIPKASLSSTGFIVKDGTNSVLAGWVYHTNSDIAWLEFVISNPEIKGEIRDQAFDLLFNVTSEYAKVNNFKNIFTSVKHPNLMKRLEKNQFVKADENMTNFIRSL